MIKIGIVCYPTFGGSGIVATELGRGLSKKKYSVHFISYREPVRLPSNNRIFFHKVNVPLYPLFHYPPYELALTAKIAEVVESHQLDILHVHYAIPHAYAAINAKKILISKGIKVPVVTTLHGTDITLVGKNPFVLSAVNYAINESDCITAVSNYLKRETLENFNIKKDVIVIPNFINFSNIQISSNTKSSNTKILSHISNFRPVKRVLDVIHIFHQVSKEIDSILYMVGDGPDKNLAIELVKKYNLSNKVHFVGKSKKIDKILSITDIFLLPSEKESFGLVALEAMAFSVPVITTKFSGISDIVIDDETGFTFPVGEVNNMAKKCISVLNDTNLHKSLSKNCYLKSKEFDVNKILPLYEDCYNRLL